MRLRVLGVIELAVHDAAAGAHALHVAGRYRGTVADAVFVANRATHDVADDLHVAVTVHAKAGTGLDAVFVDHAQISKAHVRRVVVAGKRKRVVRLEPAVVGPAALSAKSQGQHIEAFQTKRGGWRMDTCPKPPGKPLL